MNIHVNLLTSSLHMYMYIHVDLLTSSLHTYMYIHVDLYNSDTQGQAVAQHSGDLGLDLRVKNGQESLGTHLHMQISHLHRNLERKQASGDQGEGRSLRTPGSEGLDKTEWTPEVDQVLSVTPKSLC